MWKSNRRKLIICECKNCIFKTEEGKCPKDSPSDVFTPGTRIGCINPKGTDFITEEEMSL